MESQEQQMPPEHKIEEQLPIDHQVLHMELVDQPPHKPRTYGWLGSFCGLHNKARVISVALVAICVFVLVSIWQNRLELDTVQMLCLDMSIFCTATLLFGSFASIHVLYIPAVYIMRLVMIKYMIYNTCWILKFASQVDTFAIEATLRTKKTTVHLLNQNFDILTRCVNLLVQAWICLLIFGCLQLVTKDYHRLRAKSHYASGLHSRVGNFMNIRGRRLLFRRPKTMHSSPPADEVLDFSGPIVAAKKHLAASEPVHGTHGYQPKMDETISDPGTYPQHHQFEPMHEDKPTHD